MYSSDSLPGVLEEAQSRPRIRLGPHRLGGGGGEVLLIRSLSDRMSVVSEYTKLLPLTCLFWEGSWFDYLARCSLASPRRDFKPKNGQISAFTAALPLRNVRLLLLFFGPCRSAGLHRKKWETFYWVPAPGEPVAVWAVTHWKCIILTLVQWKRSQTQTPTQSSYYHLVLSDSFLGSECSCLSCVSISSPCLSVS